MPAGSAISFYNASSAGNAVINVSGTARFGSLGSGPLGTDNSTAGDATIIVNSGGILGFDANSTGASAAITTNSGGITDFTNLVAPGTTAGSIAGAGTYILGPKQLEVGSNGDSTEVSGVIEGAGGSLIKVGDGTLTLAGANTYTGGTTISAGTLQLGDGTSNGTIMGNVTNDATLAFDPAPGTNLPLGGDIVGTGAVTQIGAGSTTLTGTNTYLGGTLLAAGTLIAGDNSAFGSGTLTVAANPTVPTALDNTSGATALANLIVLDPSANLVVAGSNPLTLTGQISGDGALTKAGAAPLTLTSANSYSGGTLLAGGTLIAGNDSALGSGTLTVAENTAIPTTLDNTSGATALSNLIVLNPSANLVVAGSNPLTLAGQISGAGELTKDGASTLILTSDNTYSGGTTINAGTLQVGDGGATGSIGSGPIVDNGVLVFNRSGTVTVPGATRGSGSLTQAGVGGGTLVLTGGDTYAGGTTIASGTLQLGAGGTTGSIIGDVVNNGILAFNRSDPVTFPGTISGSGAVAQIGVGSTTLTAANDYSGGTLLAAGALIAGDNSALGSGTLTVAPNPTTPTALDNTTGATALSNLIVLIPSATLVVAGSNPLTLAGQISGAGALTKAGAAPLTLTSANSYSGGTLLAAGTLIAGNNSALGSGTLTVAANPTTPTTLDNTSGATALSNPIVLNSSANLIVGGSNPLTLAGQISGAGALTKNGAALLILTSDNSYSGGTTINAGTLQVGNGGAAGSIGTGPVLNNSALVFNRGGTVTVPGAITGTGSLTQAGVAGGTLVLTGANTYSGGTTIASGTLQLGAGGTTGGIIGDVLNNGVLAFNRSNTVFFSGAISGSGAVAQIGSGVTILNAVNPYTGGTTVSAGALVVGDPAHPGAALSGGGSVTVGSGATLGGYGSITGSVINSGIIAPGSASPGFSGSPTGALAITGNVTNQGVVRLGSGTSIGNVLQVNGNYIGAGGTLAINTFLGGDGSPSDILVINGAGAAATGQTLVHVTNISGPGGPTISNGILVVNATNGATTAAGAFVLANAELRAGSFDYRLFQGGPTGADPQDWFLRSTFNGQGGGGGNQGGTDPPPEILPPGEAFPIIGPELATYGVVQPIARQMGLIMFGTLHERVGDTGAAGASCQSVGLTGPSAAPASDDYCPVWGRLFGQQINNRYQAFADPRATGQVLGVQVGADIWRGSLLPGHSDVVGAYFAYGNSNVDVKGLVTNAESTAYVLERTGSLNLDAYSLGAYWTHYGPSGWYADLVLHGTIYSGQASTQFAQLSTDGTGFIASLEGGYPIPLPLGPRFVLEPEGQILWQQVSLRDAHDALGAVALGTTSGATGRLGLRGKWTVDDAAGREWQPYALANVWRDWDASATTTFGVDPVPLKQQATRIEFAGGVTAKLQSRLSFYAQFGYQFSAGGDNTRREGVKGDFGVHYAW